MTKLFWILLLTSKTTFGLTLEDPKDDSRWIRRDFPEITSTPFVCNQPVEFLQTVTQCRFYCDAHSCRQDCAETLPKTFLVQAENCQSSTIDIVSEIGWLAKVTQKHKPRLGQTWIEELFESADFFIVPSGTVQIGLLIREQRIWVDDNGEEHELETDRLTLEYQADPALAGVTLQLILDVDKRGLDQLLYFGVGIRVNESYFFKKKGLL